MPLQKCFLFKKINKKNFWIISFWLSGHNVELGEKLKNASEKPDGFINLQKHYIKLSEMLNMVIILYEFEKLLV